MSSKMQNTELSLGDPGKGRPEHPFFLSPPPLQHRTTERLRRWNCSSVYPKADVLLSFTQTDQQELSPFTAVTSVKPAQTIGMGLRSTPSHAWREGKSWVWHQLSTKSTPCLIEPAGLQQCTDKQRQDDQITSEQLGLDHRHFASQALTLRWPHIFEQLIV